MEKKSLENERENKRHVLTDLISPVKDSKSIYCTSCEPTMAHPTSEIENPSKRRETMLKNLTNNWVTSSKIEAIIKILSTASNEKKFKTIIFSQFTSMIDVIEIKLQSLNQTFYRCM